MEPERSAFDCIVGVPGWRLHVAQLYLSEGRELGSVMDMAIEGASKHLMRSCPDGDLDRSEMVGTIREGLQQLGIDAKATPPCSEQLLSSFIAADAIPRGSLAWEFLAVLTVKSQAPWTVIDRGMLRPPLHFRVGDDGLPLLSDREGVKGNPWLAPAPADLEDFREPVFICYLPETLFRSIDPKSHLGRVVWMTFAFRFAFERSISHKR
jgi:hypothetical protein